MGAEVRWFLLFCLSFLAAESTVPHRRFEYKYSFKPPYLAQKDGSVPFWEYGGNAIASSDNVRVAPSLKSQKGAIWTKSRTNFDWWEVDIVFRITGRGRIGADGLAFWYTENKGSFTGPVFGSSDKWVGLGVFFDSFDNDNKHNNPFIMAVVNDGTQEFDHANDGSSQMLSGCLKDFRNKPFPTRAKIEYYMNTLTVLFHNGMTNSEQDFEICLRAENVVLPKNGYFGISAATGGLADDHDVLHFLTTSLYPPGQQPTPHGQPRVSPEEEQKLSQEYAEYQKKLEHQKEEYRKEHPAAAGTKDPESEFEDWFESDSQRELKQILSGHSVILDQIRLLSQKMDETIGKQERALSLLSAISTGGIPQQIAQHGAPPPHPSQGQPMIDTIRRHEVEAMLTNENTMISAIREIRSYIAEINPRLESIIQNQGKAPTAQVMGYDTINLIKELKENMNGVRRDTEATAQRLMSNPQCQSCVSPVLLIVTVSIHLGILLLYFMYRDNKESRAKKFY